MNEACGCNFISVSEKEAEGLVWMVWALLTWLKNDGTVDFDVARITRSFQPKF